MRRINEIIVHCAATKEGQHFTVGQIRKWHTDPKKYVRRGRKRVNVGGRGWNDIGYHFVFELDGTLRDGRPIGVVGSHTRGHNRNTIGICYVGGVDADGRPKDTRTRAQKAGMRKLILQLIAQYGITKIRGHRDYAAKACPSFDARREYTPLLKQPYNPKPFHQSGTALGLYGAEAGGAGSVADGAYGLYDATEQASWRFEMGSIVQCMIGLAVIGFASYSLYRRWVDAGRPSLREIVRGARGVDAMGYEV